MMRSKAFLNTIYTICIFCPIHLLSPWFYRINDLWDKIFNWKKLPPTGERILELLWWISRKGWQWFLHAWAKKYSLLYFNELERHHFRFQITPRNELTDLPLLFQKIYDYHFVYGVGTVLAQKTTMESDSK